MSTLFGKPVSGIFQLSLEVKLISSQQPTGAKTDKGWARTVTGAKLIKSVIQEWPVSMWARPAGQFQVQLIRPHKPMLFHTSTISTYHSPGFWPGCFSVPQFHVAEKEEGYNSVQGEQISKTQKQFEFQRWQAPIKNWVLMLPMYLREPRMLITVLIGALREVTFINHLKILWGLPWWRSG